MDSFRQLTNYQKFIVQFINLYKQEELLWNTKNPNYKIRDRRQEAYEGLILKCKEFFSEANYDFAREKLRSLQDVFRREHKKVLASKIASNDPNELYKPNLWYYNLMLFTTDEKLDKDGSEEVALLTELAGKTCSITDILGSTMNLPAGDQLLQNDKLFVLEFIKIYKEQELLWNPSHPKYTKRFARQKAYQPLISKCREFYGTADQAFVERKVSNLRTSFKREHKKVLSSKETSPENVYKPSLWYYNLLLFIVGEKRNDEFFEKLIQNNSTTETSVNKPDTTHTYDNNQIFTLAFIKVYKKEEVLWNTNHSHYKSKFYNRRAYEKLVAKCREFNVPADENFVRKKLQNLRTCFRREYNKVIASRQWAKNENEVYKPNLFYYNLFLFLVGEDHDNKEMEEIDNLVKANKPNISMPIQWNKKSCIILLKLYKMHPILYNPLLSINGKTYKKKEAITQMTNKLNKISGNNFSIHQIRKQINRLRCQLNKEISKERETNETDQPYKSGWWGYKMMEFLIPVIDAKCLVPSESPAKCETSSDEYTNSDNDDTKNFSTDDCDIKSEVFDIAENEQSLSPNTDINNCQPLEVNINSDLDEQMDFTMSSSISTDFIDQPLSDSATDPFATLNDTDIFDTMARNIAHQLREMTLDQRVMAEKIIKDVMYHGQMEELTSSSRFILDGD